jgi:ABC-2 type transport system permease protein
VLSRLVFGVQWGELLPLTLVLVSADLAAAGFGIFALSLIKTTKQVPIMMGGVLTVTSMLGVFPAMMQSVPTLTTISLFTPQGWSVNALKALIDGGGLAQVLLPIAVLLGMAVVCFVVGVLLFRRRFA